MLNVDADNPSMTHTTTTLVQQTISNVLVTRNQSVKEEQPQRMQLKFKFRK
eukprot:m.39536 g.39536  ORF g.39536 m.39536 type:complete len:51 (+) comp14726_c0_seq4:188-340(+)